MIFKDIVADFIAGVPIKRKSWGGYWLYKDGQIEIHTKTGEIIYFNEVKDIIFTLSHITQDDWEIATNENCVIEVKCA